MPPLSRGRMVCGELDARQTRNELPSFRRLHAVDAVDRGRDRDEPLEADGVLAPQAPPVGAVAEATLRLLEVPQPPAAVGDHGGPLLESREVLAAVVGHDDLLLVPLRLDLAVQRRRELLDLGVDLHPELLHLRLRQPTPPLVLAHVYSFTAYGFVNVLRMTCIFIAYIAINVKYI